MKDAKGGNKRYRSQCKCRCGEANDDGRYRGPLWRRRLDADCRLPCEEEACVVERRMSDQGTCLELALESIVSVPKPAAASGQCCGEFAETQDAAEANADAAAAAARPPFARAGLRAWAWRVATAAAKATRDASAVEAKKILCWRPSYVASLRKGRVFMSRWVDCQA